VGVRVQVRVMVRLRVGSRVNPDPNPIPDIYIAPQFLISFKTAFKIDLHYY
jgi:hypothetical protein